MFQMRKYISHQAGLLRGHLKTLSWRQGGPPPKGDKCIWGGQWGASSLFPSLSAPQAKILRIRNCLQVEYVVLCIMFVTH